MHAVVNANTKLALFAPMDVSLRFAAGGGSRMPGAHKSRLSRPHTNTGS